MTEQKSRADLLREMAEIIDSSTTYATPGNVATEKRKAAVTSQAGFWPELGAIACDCAYRHQRIVDISGDVAKLEDGSFCSVKHCLVKAEDDNSCHPKGTDVS